ncbi:uncharacterized protein LOC135072501 isoform X1 [Ostrinia nubilalis]|uniref:uncharacterized protein LOC135072501 isoform X1 n=1 Tax=Ostrinia nubilalis TaxID=29057 RepID=UPI003082415B
MVRTVVIVVSVLTAAAVAAGIGVLIWWLVADHSDNGNGEIDNTWLEGIPNTAGFAEIPDIGKMFWWFFPSLASEASSRPLILWLDGVTGDPPSLLANFGMFGPFDFNLEKRNDSWVDDYNLLFVDAPLGTGFSTIASDVEIPGNLDTNTEHLLQALESFYARHEEFVDTPLYIVGQGYGAQLAMSLVLGLDKAENSTANLKGIVIGNGIISPAVALTKLGFYLEELGYIDGNGRAAIENFSNETTYLVSEGQLAEAYEKFLSLGEFVNEEAGAVAVNLGHIVEKVTYDSTTKDIFGQKKYLRDVTGFNVDFNTFMIERVAPALGISEPNFDSRREEVIQAFKDVFMRPAKNMVEEILENTNLTVTIYNGNLDAVSNTPGQLEWVDNLEWSGQGEFLISSRQTLIVNGLIEGYFRETDKLKFYWMNAAGVSVPLDSPVGMRRIVQRIVDSDGGNNGNGEDEDDNNGNGEDENDGNGEIDNTWLEGIPNTAEFAEIPDVGKMFWWFFPSLASEASSRPLILWLDGVTGDPPSLLANFGMFGPFDFNLEKRNDSWVDDYNLLFVDAPLGTGFSTIASDVEIPGNLDTNTEHLLQALESFYARHEEFVDTPLYIVGQGYGAQLAMSLVLGLDKVENSTANLKGIVIGNGIISPAVALTKLGFYLEELGYIDGNGRAAIENFSNETTYLVSEGQLAEAYEKFLSLGEFVNEEAGAVAVNLGHIVEKVTYDSATKDIFGQKKYLRDVTGFNVDFNTFMTERVAPALGISEPDFDSRREEVIQAFKDVFMRPAKNMVEEILENTNLTVTIYNGNLDAVSNTPGQLEWVDNLEWSGQGEFLISSRQTLIVNGLIEGYFRETDKLKFYWMNAAGVSVPLDSPVGMRRIVQRIVDSDGGNNGNGEDEDDNNGNGEDENDGNGEIDNTWLEGIPNTAEFAEIPDVGKMFWWFFPSLASEASSRPLILWLDGVTGDPPSLLANFGMFGPFDFNLEKRNDSWVDDYNLLFVDAPLGTGFSTIASDVEIPGNLDTNTEHLLQALESFYARHEEFVDTPLYIVGQGYGAQLAMSLVLSLDKAENSTANLKGIVIGNGIISPAVALTKLGFYLEELGYIDGNGRAAIEIFSNETTYLVSEGQLAEAYEKFLSLGEFVNEEAGAVAVNLGHIVEKVTYDSTTKDIFGQKKYLRDVTGFNVDFNTFMTERVAPALGISEPDFDSRREEVIQAFKDVFMRPAKNMVEEILENTNLTVTIYNGNLDAVSNTPGQLEWVDNLEWSGQGEFLISSRQTLIVNGLIEGYFRETDKLKLYWMNAAGVSVPLDSPVGMRRVVQRIVDN